MEGIMGRPRVHEVSASGTTSASRSAAWRQRKREAAGLKPVLTPAQKHEIDKQQRRAQLVALKTQLSQRWGAEVGAATWRRLYQDEAERLGIAE
jgi:hypothetical protein